jgi:hypothetical protein
LPPGEIWLPSQDVEESSDGFTPVDTFPIGNVEALNTECFRKALLKTVSNQFRMELE